MVGITAARLRRHPDSGRRVTADSHTGPVPSRSWRPRRPPSRRLTAVCCVSSRAGTLPGDRCWCTGEPRTRDTWRNPWLEDAAQRGIRLVSYDRPGYGGSTPQPGRTVADCANDVRTIADAFGFDRLAVWGFSGGGPHALACAALLPGPCVRRRFPGVPRALRRARPRLLQRHGEGQRGRHPAVLRRPSCRASRRP